MNGESQLAPATSAPRSAWFVARVPDDWFAAVPRTIVDRGEILVMGELPDVDPIANRTLTLTYGTDSTQVVSDTVQSWNNVGPCGP